MVSFRIIATAVLAGLATPTFATITPNEIRQSLIAVASKSEDLQTPARELTLLNAANPRGPLPILLAGFADIFKNCGILVVQLRRTEKISESRGIDASSVAVRSDTDASPEVAPEDADERFQVADAAAIAEAFRNFVRVHQALLNILIGKSGLIAALPIVGPPVAAALRLIEGIVDSIAFALINAFENAADIQDISNDSNALKGTLNSAINKYAGRPTKRDVSTPLHGSKRAVAFAA